MFGCQSNECGKLVDWCRFQLPGNQVPPSAMLAIEGPPRPMAHGWPSARTAPCHSVQRARPSAWRVA